MKKVLLVVSLTSIFVWLQYRLWVGDGNVLTLRALSQKYALEAQQVAELTKRNQKLDIEVQALKGSKAALEEQARLELGMIKKGETFYLVTE